MKYLLWKGRFPRGRSALPEGSVEFVAKQVGVAAAEIGFYDWDGRQIKRHRAQLRAVLGFRECTVADAEKLTAWLVEQVCQTERRAERVREQLLAHLRAERIEPPAPSRIGRIVGSALQQAEQTLTLRLSGRIPDAAVARMHTLVAEASDDPAETEEPDGREVFAQVRTDPGNVSLKTCETETALSTWEAAQSVGVGLAERSAPLPDGLVGDHDPALQHHLLDLAEAQRETVIEPHAMTDDLRREAEPSVRRRLGAHQPSPLNALPDQSADHPSHRRLPS